MTDRPHVLLSVAASIDGYIDDNTDQRLLLSNDEDFDRVDEVRSGVDAILVGANTIRRDNPRLLVRSQARRDRRLATGSSESPIKVTITATGDLDPAASFVDTPTFDRLVRNTYKVLLTRGMVGTVLYSPDPETRHALHQLVKGNLVRT